MKRLFNSVVSLACCLLLTISAFAAGVQPSKELREQADRVLSDTDNVRASKSVAVVFEYALALERSGQTNAALRYRERGLTLSPWRLDQQMAYALQMRSAGQTNVALERARIVFQRAETDELISQASAMLNTAFEPVLLSEPWPWKTPSLALVPIGEVDAWLVRALQTNLAATLKIPVVIKQVPLTVPPPNRDNLKLLADRCREPLKQFQVSRQADRVALQLGLASSYKDDDEAMLKVFREMLKLEAEAKKNVDAVPRFDEELRWTRKLGPQWRADELLKKVNRAMSASRPEGSLFLGITRLDLFGGESRFIFGVGDSASAGALLSYFRFTAALMDQPADRERLIKRTLKQALSSVGFAIGVQRCSNPACARAYPNSLEEHDAKGSDLCEVCRAQFETMLQRK